jgi:DNA polymerase I-like protein with 3'-5' exonuclease and polymerase domains
MSLIASYHPTFAFFYAPTEYGVFQTDLQRFARMLGGTTRAKPKALVTNPTVGQIEAMFRSAPRIATDIETRPEHWSEPWTGKDPLRAKLRAIGLGNTEWGLALDCTHNNIRQREAIKKGYENQNIVKVLHNGIWYDDRCLKRYGFKLNNTEDTRDARMALSPTSPLRLGYLASLYDDTNPWKESEEDDAKGLVFTRDMQKLLRYCAQDCVETARVDEGILAEPEWKEERVQNLYRLHKELSAICAEMHTTGFNIHALNRQFLAWGLDLEYKEQKKILLKLVNIPGFRGTDYDLRSLIYKRHETPAINRFHMDDPVDPAMWTETGLISVNFDSLLQILIDPYTPPELQKIIKVVWRMKSAQKARSTFVVSEKVQHAIGRDGRLRPGWNSCGTDTGRFSCSEPNVMNLEQYLRAMYCAGEGNVLVHGDYSQLELRVMAVVAQDQVLQDALDSGDVYEADARAVFGVPEDQPVKKAARQSAKQVHLACQYAAGTPAVYGQVLSQDFDAQYTKVRAIHEAMKKRYHRTVTYWEEEQKRVHASGYSASRILDRRRYYSAEPPITEIANYPIQSTASDVMNLMIVRLRNRLRKEVSSARLVGQLHDATDVETPERHATKVASIKKDEMERPVVIGGRNYYFPAKIMIAKGWEEL